MTPAYLQQIGLLDAATPASDDTGLLLRQALDKIAFLPFGLLIDQWRWRVFSGDIAPEHYNTSWWDLRRRSQGVDAPVARSGQDFDPGAKCHVPANYPYTRYFLARILEFQFHRSLCEAAGQRGPSTAVPFTEAARPGSGCSARWPWEPAAPGPMRWRRSPEDGR